MRAPLILALILLLVAVGASPGQAQAADELADMLRDLRRARDPSVRAEALLPIARVGGARAARLLGRVVAEDADTRVRVRAAQCLGIVRAEVAAELIEHLLRRGGTRGVRAALALAMQRQRGAERVLVSLRSARTPLTERLLLVEALGAFKDPKTRGALIELVEGGDPHLAASALGALMRRRDDPRIARVAYLTKLLTSTRDTDTLLVAMDGAQEVIDPLLKAPLLRLGSFLEPEIREGAEHLLQCIEIQAMKKRHELARAALAAGAKDHDDRYAPRGKPGSPGSDGDHFDPPSPPPPPVRAAFDTVYVLDVTGSTWSHLPHLIHRLRGEAARQVAQGGSVRVGIVAYAGNRGRGAKRMQVLPLTFDPERVRTFLDGLEAGGVDDRGAAVAPALREALDRMSWRWTARRTVQLFADTDVGDAAMAKRVVGMHRKADHTRTHVGYVLRTRGRVPPIYAELARLGGSAELEILR